MSAFFEDTTLAGCGLDLAGLTRAEQRQRALAQRMALDPLWHQQASAAVCAHLLTALTELGCADLSGRVLAVYWPIQGEPDLRPVVARLRAAGAAVALPVVDGPGLPLRFRVWLADDPLLADRYGIATPTRGDWVAPQVVVMPGHAFDRAGFRLGYGGGFYDRTLAQMAAQTGVASQPAPLTLGVCFASALVPDLQPQAHDQPVDALVSEAGWQRIAAKG